MDWDFSALKSMNFKLERKEHEILLKVQYNHSTYLLADLEYHTGNLGFVFFTAKTTKSLKRQKLF